MRKFYLLLLTLSGWLLPSTAQQTDIARSGRLSPAAIKKITDNHPTTWWLLCKDIQSLRRQLIKTGAPPILRHDPRTGLTVLKCSWQQVETLLREPGLIRYADKPRIPREELTIISFDASANQLNTAHHLFPAIDGRNLVLSLKERKPDTTDIDFRGRFLRTSLADPLSSTHASIMATMAAGGGNSHITGKGAAPGASISSASFTNLLPETDEDYQRYRISVQNHSYGTGIENYYGADALAYDATVIAHPALLHVFSAGNDGSTTGDNGAYAGIPGFANLTGSFKMAKNIITVGAVDSFYNVAGLSSRGPAYDGRLKPELVAYGQDGSSGAAAIVSGICLLLQRAWQLSGMPDLPPASLVKAILINSADNIGNEGPDYASGYGNANAANAILTMFNKRYFTGTIQQNETKTFDLDIGNNISKLTVTLNWTDPPADPAAAKALIDDLDLQLVHTSSGTIFLPWILSHAPHADSLKKPARRGPDTLNSTEQVSIRNPAAGNYQLQVKHNRMLSASQNFSIAYQLDTINQFKWYAPTGSDALRGGASYVIRWASTFAENTGPIEYSTDGNNWNLITAAAPLNKHCFRWEVPEINSPIRLRITVGSNAFLSDEFIVSARHTGYTGFNCPDSFLIGWNKPAGITQWQVYTVGDADQYLRPIVNNFPDTALIFRKSQRPELHYAIAPIIDGRPGQKSFTFDYTTQGVDCYIRSFLADPDGPKVASISAELGSLHGVSRIILEKATLNGYARLQTISTPDDLTYNWRDEQLVRGNNTYRLKLEMQSGAVIYSQPASVLTSLDAPYLLYPNPVAASGSLLIYTADFAPAWIQVFNAQGQLVKQQALQEYPQPVSIYGLKNGIYFLIVSRDGKKLYRTPFIVR